MLIHNKTLVVRKLAILRIYAPPGTTQFIILFTVYTLEHVPMDKLTLHIILP
jgi:hypothetical protein